MFKFYKYLAGFLLLLSTPFAHAQEIPFSQQVFDERRSNYIDDALIDFNNEAIVLQAYRGLPVNQEALNAIINRVYTSGEFDFNLVQLVRLMYFTDGEYDQQITDAVKIIPLWLTPKETLRVYWSENHIIMWTSSAYLLRQKYPELVNDPELDKKLNAWLDTKIQYGFYEFFSSVYFPYTLSGILNLVDFSEDPVIREKATLCAQRLLSEALLLVNDKGTFYPAAGRNYPGKYETPYNQNHNHLFYMLTGFGEVPRGSSHSGTFLSTSTVDVKPIVESWKSKENKILSIGHPLNKRKEIYANLTRFDRTVFQWSGGAYFHPEVASETYSLINSYDLWDHKEFKAFSIFKGLPASLATPIAKFAASISESSVYGSANIAIFKNKSVTLTSIQDYWKGHAGYQQWPWAANTGTIPVFTRSGNESTLLGEDELNNNSTLPYLQQKDNVLLVMYRANKDLALFGFEVHDIGLQWNDARFDEISEEGKWIIGREGNSYIAVLRHCTDTINGERVCDDQDGQLWAAIVGNEDMYGTFEQFKQVVATAQYKEEWIKRNNGTWTYYGMVDIDGKKIEHYWDGNLLGAPDNPATGIKYLEGNAQGFEMYPNPARQNCMMKLDEPVAGNCLLRIFDITGKEVHVQSFDGIQTPYIEIPVRNWPIGLYSVILETPGATWSRKLMIQ